MRGELPWSVELDQNLREFGEHVGEVLGSEDEDVVLFGVAVGQQKNRK